MVKGLENKHLNYRSSWLRNFRLQNFMQHQIRNWQLTRLRYNSKKQNK